MKICIFVLSFLFLAVPAWSQSLTLTWSDVANEEGYILERGDVVIQLDGTFLADNFVEITQLAQDAVTYVDATITGNRFYCYRIASFITVTNASPPVAKSAFSNIVCGMFVGIILRIP